jgi:aminoglycoside phosphotransferase (APT) family kinase protein
MPIPQQRDLERARKTLTGWLSGRLPGATDLELSEVTGPAFTGFSNETLMFDASWMSPDGRRQQQGMVVRVKPTGHAVFLESEFEVQYRMMEILGAATDVPVPGLIGYEDDQDLLGAPFFLMKKIDGRIPTDNPPYHTGGWLTGAGQASSSSSNTMRSTSTGPARGRPTRSPRQPSRGSQTTRRVRTSRPSCAGAMPASATWSSARARVSQSSTGKW